MSSSADQNEDCKEDVEYWSNRWEEGRTGFHKKLVNPNLVTFLNKLTDDSPKKFFVPLCGKSLDLVYLREKGHEVFGVEAVQKAIEELEAENSLGLKFNEAESTYSTEDGKLKVYLGDIFQCPLEKFGPFDCVWDRGSFVALEYPIRSDYIKMMQRSLKSLASGENVTESETSGDRKTAKYYNFRYLLETVDYDRSKFGGPPRAVSEIDMEKFYGEWTYIEVVQRQPEVDGRVRSIPNIGSVDCVIYFLTPKAIV